MTKATLGFLSLWGLLLSMLPSQLLAQAGYPSAPIRLVLGNAPGATTDTIARLLATKLSAQMNTNVVVDNKPGAGGNIGPEFVAKSRPDGYTLLLNTPGVVYSRAFGEKMGYDLFDDLTPITLVASGVQILAVHPSVPANTPAEFIDYVRANPNKLSYGSSGVGNINHLGPLVFLTANGLSALHVPYKGSAAAIIDLVGGRVQFAMQGLVAVVPLVKEKRIKIIGIASLKRSQLLPEVPTLAEATPGFEISSWFGIMAPVKTPTAILTRLNTEITKAMQDSEIKSRLAQEGVEVLSSTREEYAAYIKSETERWTKFIRSNNIKPE